MKSLLLALQFLTIIPVSAKDGEGKTSNSLIYFPVIGLLLGLILAGVSNLLSIFNFEEFISNIILVITLVALTGGLHLDGLADTVDAFLSGKSKDQMLNIMRDSHIGVMGVLSLICIILLKIAFLSSISTAFKTTSLLLMCILSRWSLVLAIFLFPYARTEGKAMIFFEGKSPKVFLLSTLMVLILLGFTLKVSNLLILLLIIVLTLVISYLLKRKFGGLTGDMLGALCELNELAVLLLIPILIKLKCY